MLSCSHSQASGVDLSEGLPLPSVPDSLREPKQRADYLIAHYWDDMDFSDAKYSLDTVFMETAFSTYASVLPVATPGSPMQAKVDALMEQAAVNSKAYRFLADIAEKYLSEVDSPVYSQEAYLYFVNAQLKGHHIDQAARTRLSFQQKSLSLNLPGTQANDFEFVGRDGATHSLSSCLGSAEKYLIIFYDPDCDDCHQYMAQLDADPATADAIAAHELTVIAIANSETRDRWEATMSSLPTAWIVGCDITDVEGNDLYYLPSNPSLYLLDRHGTVLLKNFPPTTNH